MNNMQINGITMKAVSMAVPNNIEFNSDLSNIFGQTETKKISDTIGIYSRRIAETGVTALDLMYDAVSKLLKSEELNIAKIDCLVCVSQTPDYIIPGNSFVLCSKLKARENIFTLDINAGCSGFTHGMITIAKLMQNSNMRYGILVTGDTLSRLINPMDQSLRFLFGDAAAACLVEKDEHNEGMTVNWKTIASNYDKIMTIAGGMRNPTTVETKRTKLMEDKNHRSENDLFMKGADVFSFAIKEVPEIVNEILSGCQLSVNDINFFVFHQANRFIVDYIQKKLKIAENQIVINIDKTGNTSSASILIALCLEAQKREVKKLNGRFCFTGFGAGLSLSSIIINIQRLNITI